MFNTSECLHNVGPKTIGQRWILSGKRRMSWSMLLVMIGCLLASPPAAFPQWTTSGSDISNTNTGNVGIGTGGTAPVYKLNIAGSEDKSQIRFGLGALDSGSHAERLGWDALAQHHIRRPDRWVDMLIPGA